MENTVAMRAAAAPVETFGRLQPLRIGDGYPALLADLAGEVVAESARLGSGLPDSVVESLKTLCLALNTYASNRIEGHDTEPAEVMRAMQGTFSSDEKRSDLEREAAAHAEVQSWIDHRVRSGELTNALEPRFIREIHARFFESSPREFLVVRGQAQELYCALPGRSRGPTMDVVVGEHIPPPGALVDDWLDRLCAHYDAAPRGKISRLLDLAAAHHRLLYLHPFSEGNGRVVRLVTHAQIQLAGVGSGGLWSISRGLGRGLSPGLEGRSEYKRRLHYADAPRDGDLDGRGNLSLRTLRDFVEWFLRVMLDQIRFMSGLYQLDALSERFERLARESVPTSPEAAARIARATLREGDLPRSRAWEVTGLSERSGRSIVKTLLDAEVLESDSPRGALKPRLMHQELFPRLF